jgi:hypothetical protein
MASRFLDPYYICNALLVAAYLPLRLYFRVVTPDGSDYGRLHSIHEFWTWVRNRWHDAPTVLLQPHSPLTSIEAPMYIVCRRLKLSVALP